MTGLEPATSAVTGQRSEPVELHPRPPRAETRIPKSEVRNKIAFEFRHQEFELSFVVGAKGLEPLTPSV